MMAVSPEAGERLPAQRIIGMYSPVTADEWAPAMSREMQRAK
jgi:hypothetical protein